MFGKIINRIKSSRRLYGNTSSKHFVSYLRTHGVTISDKVIFRYPKLTTIDLTRPSLIEIGENVDINANFTIMTHDFGTHVFKNLYKDFIASSGKVIIGSNVYIGRDVTILKGGAIGDNCIIGLGAIVTSNIPSNSVAVGVPCKKICTIEEYYDKRKYQQIREAIDYAISILENFHREPVISDFREEWVLFLTEFDRDITPPLEILPEISFRIGDFEAEFFTNRVPVFNGFSEFMKVVHLEYERKNKG